MKKILVCLFGLCIMFFASNACFADDDVFRSDVINIQKEAAVDKCNCENGEKCTCEDCKCEKCNCQKDDKCNCKDCKCKKKCECKDCEKCTCKDCKCKECQNEQNIEKGQECEVVEPGDGCLLTDKKCKKCKKEKKSKKAEK